MLDWLNADDGKPSPTDLAAILCCKEEEDLWLDSMISSWKLPGGMECRMFCCNYFFLSSGAHIVFADNNIPDPSPSSTTNVRVSIYTQDIEGVQKMDTWPQLFVDILWTCPWFGGWNMKIATFWHDRWSEGFFIIMRNCCLDQWGHCISFSLPNLWSWRQIRCRLVGVFDNMVDLLLLAFL